MQSTEPQADLALEVELDEPLQQEPPRLPRRRSPMRQVLSVAECVGVLLFTLILITPVFLLVPTAERLRMDLTPAAVPSATADSVALSDEELSTLESAVADLGVADRVVLRNHKTGLRLTLHGFSDEDMAEFQVHDLLAERGWFVGPIQRFREADVDAIIESPRLMFGSMLVQGLAFLLVGGIFARFRGGPWGIRSRPTRAILVGAGWGVLAAIAGMGLSSIQALLGFPVQEQEAILQMIQKINLWQLAPLLVVLAPVTEEIFFRGYVFRFLATSVSVPAAYLVSSLLFSALHMNLSGLIIYMAVGMIFAWAYRRTGNMLAPIAAHMSYNGIAMLGAIAVQLSQAG